MTLQFSVKYFGVKFKEKLLVFHVKKYVIFVFCKWKFLGKKTALLPLKLKCQPLRYQLEILSNGFIKKIYTWYTWIIW